MRTKTPHNTICNIKLSRKDPTPPPPPQITLTPIPIRQNRFTIATDDNMPNMGVLPPNSIFSRSYLLITSSSDTLAEIMNPESECPTSFNKLSITANRYELDLLYAHIRCSFHHPKAVPPLHRYSEKLYACSAAITYANGRNQRLETWRSSFIV